ncbi:hypothetical protein ACO22_00938 [Paracoccidioides brasiliensis]|uniref:Uncharacterized protein n=1 Tax=Paracoccidioides brasiliensis TaxID=121759 RepID=A0A1D2JN40_PARBR|nr:hypothetical protein ACO22_00938 [Paracoccidioides brasiliensis]
MKGVQGSLQSGNIDFAAKSTSEKVSVLWTLEQSNEDEDLQLLVIERWGTNGRGAIHALSRPRDCLGESGTTVADWCDERRDGLFLWAKEVAWDSWAAWRGSQCQTQSRYLPRLTAAFIDGMVLRGYVCWSTTLMRETVL